MQQFLLFYILIFSSAVGAEASTCYGTTSNGRLESGVQLPSGGGNFVSYSTIAGLFGRTYVHSKVRDIIVDSYEALESEAPGKLFKYAETGFEDGGRFRPHKTHRNGLSVDFMVPVVNQAGVSVYLPTNYFNKLGYNIEFNSNSQYDEYSIDYDAMAAHIASLHKIAKQHDADLWRVIFYPAFQENLFQTRYGDYLKNNIQFSRKKSWVRHDEHYHVDFLIKCRLL